MDAKLKSFLSKAKSVHGTRYDYSKVLYIKYKEPITIGCKIHGDFPMLHSNHLISNTRGCPLCTRQETFIRDAIKVHGNLYDYKKVVYIDTLSNVTIICRTHGAFEQSPNVHRNQKSGCQKCAVETTRKKPMSTEKYIERVEREHGKEYTYENTKYTHHEDSIKVTCRTHGEFSIKAKHHLYLKRGCPKCYPMSIKGGVSAIAIRWIEEEAKRRRLKDVQHAGNGVEFRVPNTRLRVDGYHHRTKTIFEFYGDDFHGNPRKWKPLACPHPYIDKTARELYKATMKREARLIKLGYKIVSIWESDYKSSKR
jgi:hypothetical protein